MIHIHTKEEAKVFLSKIAEEVLDTIHQNYFNSDLCERSFAVIKEQLEELPWIVNLIEELEEAAESRDIVLEEAA